MRMITGPLAVLIVASAFQAYAQQEPEAPLRGVFFDQGEFILREDAKPVLRENAEVLVTNPDINVEIAGYCNSSEQAVNFDLGQRRAEAAKSFLVSQGVDSRRISVSTDCDVGNWGSFSPAVSEVKLALDSRVHIEATPQAVKPST